MATRVLLLSTDEKAVHAITQILDELDVSFEHSSDAPFTLKRLATQRFDLLIVDCDNVQTATQVFNSARASALNKTAIAIAIVEGKAGVPNAFRLGASLVLTKPVSLEQVRNTLRTGIGMTRKDGPEAKPITTHTTAHSTGSPASTPATSHVAPVAQPPAPVTFSHPAPAATALPSAATSNIPSVSSHATSIPPTHISVASTLPPIAQMPVPPVIPPVSTPAPPAPRPVETQSAPATPPPPISIAPVVLPAPPIPAPPKPTVSAVEKPASTAIANPLSTEPKISIDAILEALPKAPGAPAHGVASSSGAAAAPALSKSESFSSLLAGLPETTGAAGLSKSVDETESEIIDGSDSLIDDSAASLRASAVPAFGGLNKQPFAGLEPPRHGRVGLIVGGLFVLLAGGVATAWFLKPQFRSAVLERYGVVKEHVRIWQGHSVPVAATPVPAPPAPKQPEPQAEAVPTTSSESSAASTSPSQPSATGTALPAVPGKETGSSAPVAGTPSASPVSTTGTTEKPVKTSTSSAKESGPAPSTTNSSSPKTSATSPSASSTSAAHKSEILEVPEDYADDQVIRRVRPIYPKQAHGRKLQGTVVLQAIVDRQGKVNSLQLVSGDPVLAQAAADAVKQWRYKPYSHNGDPAEFQTRVTVDFHPPADR